MSRLTVEFEELTGWGAQVGWLNVADIKAVPGLCLNRFPVFRNNDTHDVDICLPLTPGELPASRHSAVTFSTDDHRRRFCERLKVALRVARPDLFDRGRQA